MNVKKKIRHIIRWFMPFGVVRWNMQRKHINNRQQTENFMANFQKYLADGKHVMFAKNSPFQTIVSVQGFGFTGSGAMIDLLREYNSILALGSVDFEGSVGYRVPRCEEIDFLRLAGGLFEVEKYLESNNIFINDALLHRVISQIEHSDVYKNIPEARPYFYEYLYQISEVLTNNPQYQYYNAYLDHGCYTDIFYLRNISLKSYRNICREFIYSISSILKSNSEASILVLDQFVNDWELDMKRYLEYIPNLRLITVHRDPRDVYAYAKKENVEWIPHHSVDAFIKWNNIIYKKYDFSEHVSYLAVQFETLIDDYEEMVSNIEKFIGIDSATHTKKGTCMNPAVSRKNMNLWKLEIDQEDYNKIARSLPQLCYDKFE